MKRNRARPQLAFPAVIALTVVIAFLPSDWRLGWTRELAELMRFPLRPFTHMGNTVGVWLRPTPMSVEGVEDVDAYIAQLIEDRDVARRLYHRERQVVLTLEEENRQLQRIPLENRRHALKSLIAPITARNPNSTLGVVEVKPRGVAASTVTVGSVVVYAGVHVIGRTLETTADAACPVLPITSPDAGYVQARVIPREDPLRPLEQCPLIQLEPDGDGTLVGDVKGTEVLAVGDRVQLDDASWPPTAQQMVIGEVSRVRPNEQEPLRNRLTVKPLYSISQVAYVTIIIEDPDATAAPNGEGATP